MLTRTQIFAILVIYMALLITFLEAIGGTYNSTNNTLGGFGINIVTSISIIPTWLNTIFVLIPSVLLILLIVSWFMPTVNPGS